MFVAALLAEVLLASAVLARPSLKERNERRKAAAHQSRPLNRVVDSNGEPVKSTITNTEYSSNWAGGVLNSGAGTYKSVTATFIVPTPSASGLGLLGEYSASAWVGIDGDTCENAILQTGVDFNVEAGFVSYDAWYEWYPDYAYDFSGISFKAGDEVQLTVTASTVFSGTASIKNLSSGQSVSKAIVSASALCEQDAEWIVEDFEEGSSLVPFANFGKVTFSNAKATTSGGSVGPALANVIDIQQAGITLTSVSTGSSSVTVTYV